MKHVIHLLVLFAGVLLSAADVKAQSRFTVSGTIKDAANGEGLIGAIVQIQGQAVGTSTNEYGFYSLTLPSGNYTLVYSYLGYVNQTRPVTLNQSQRIDIQLASEDVQIEEVVVTSTKP